MAGNMDAFAQGHGHGRGEASPEPVEGAVRAHPETGYRQVRTANGWVNEDEPYEGSGSAGVLHFGFRKDPSTLNPSQLEEVKAQSAQRGRGGAKIAKTRGEAIAQGEEVGQAPIKPASEPGVSDLVNSELERIKNKQEGLAPEVMGRGRGRNRGSRGKSSAESAPTEPEHLPGRRFGGHILTLHRHLDNIVRTMKATSDPNLHVLADMANRELNGEPKTPEQLGFKANDPYLRTEKGAKVTEQEPNIEDHVWEGDSLLRDRRAPEGRKEYIKAANKLVRAHNILSNDYVAEAGKRLSINTELPSLDDLTKAIRTSNVQAGSSPFKKVNWAGEQRDIDSEDMRGVAKKAAAEPGTAANSKIRAARSGSGRVPKRLRNEDTQGRAAVKASLVTKKASKKSRDVSFRTQAQDNVPEIMKKPD